MFIKTQCETTIANTENITIIAINTAQNSCEIGVIMAGDDVLTLGSYKTPERTKEVFDDLSNALIYRTQDYYKMPKE